MMIIFCLKFTRKIHYKKKWIISSLSLHEFIEIVGKPDTHTIPKIKAEALRNAKAKIKDIRWVCKDIAEVTKEE